MHFFLAPDYATESVSLRAADAIRDDLDESRALCRESARLLKEAENLEARLCALLAIAETLPAKERRRLQELQETLARAKDAVAEARQAQEEALEYREALKEEDAAVRAFLRARRSFP